MRAKILRVVTHAPELGPKPRLEAGGERLEGEQTAQRTEVRRALTEAEVKFLQAQVAEAAGKLWGKLHRRALEKEGTDDSAWLEGFAIWLPCGACRAHWNEMLQATPPDWENYFAWTVARHNEVSRRLGKPEMTVEQARARWAILERTTTGEPSTIQ